MTSNVTRFFRDSGLKILAMADMNSCDYSIVLYLLNCAMSGLDRLITTETELGSIIGFPPGQVRSSLESLTGRGMIKSTYGDGTQSPKIQSMSLGLQWDVSKWKLGLQQLESVDSHHEAIIFPFRKGSPHLQLVDGQRHDVSVEKPIIHRSHGEIQSWQRIMEGFARGRDMDDHERRTSETVAQTLADTHPIDQVLVLIKHFGQKIPTLSLLASNWQHYVEQYEQESQKLDLFDIKQKQLEQDQKVRDAAQSFLERRDNLDLSDEEVQVLQLLAAHRHPRRQLFWAHQMRLRYPKLTNFFTETHAFMLPITQTGQVVKMPNE